MTDQCSTCFFGKREGDGVTLRCKYYPPQLTFWPTVQDADWCAHFSGQPLDLSSNWVVPIGGCIPFFGSTPPNSNFVFPYGQAVDRTTYATLFGLIGTTFGAGDGSTTFNLPDLRGRTIAGQDNMGGSAASRLTSPLNGSTFGAAGGNQNVASSAPTISGAGADPANSSGSAYFQVSFPLVVSPGAATSVVQPTMVAPWILRVL